MPSVFAVLAAIALPGAAMSGGDAPQPVRLVVDRRADMLDIAVVADAAVPDATFRLDITSEGAGGRTTTSQSGSGKGSVAGARLLVSRIGTSGLAAWHIRLKVTAGGKDYEVVRTN